MNTLINRIDIDENTRISVYLDEYEIHECPAEWGDSADQGMLTLRAGRGFQSYAIGDDAENAQDAMNAYDEYVPFNGGNRADPMWAAIKHLERKGFQVKYECLRGSSQSDWMDVLIWSKHDASALAKSIQQWFTGDIYMVSHETRSTWAKVEISPNPGQHFETFEQWDCEGSVCGVYFDNAVSNAEVVAFASDNFGIKIPETVSA